MKIAITGATGMVGTALRESLMADDHEVITVSRTSGENTAVWNLDQDSLETDKLSGCDAIVNLAGSSIAQRWTKAIKAEILDSRIKGTELISKSAVQLSPKPKVLISASGVGYYGPGPGKPVDENAPLGPGFLADVCKHWEAATEPAEAAGLRVVHVRIGVVMSPKGGALAKMLTPFKAGLGGPVGNGKQMVSWISLDDLVGILRFCIANDSAHGAINAASPNPVSNAEFASTLGSVLGKPAIIPAPAFALKLAMGEMVNETVLADQTVIPRRLQEHGYNFAHTELKEALQDALSE